MSQNGGYHSNGIHNEAFLSSSSNLDKHSQAIAMADRQIKGSNSDSESDTSDFRSLLPFCIIFGIGSMVSQSVTVYLSSQITVFEKAYGLSSSNSGLLLSANDAGFVIAVLFASHFLKNSHIPRILGFCVLLFGVSGIVTSLPNFIFERQDLGGSSSSNTSSNTGLCNPRFTAGQPETQQCTQSDTDTKESATSTWVMIIIGLSMVVQGVAKAPRTPLANLYMDNNSAKESTALYIGILMAFSIFGPFVAIMLGGFFNRIPVDLQDTTMNERDPRWVGAWWLGFVAFGAGAILISVPICCFPASLKKKQNDEGPTEYANSVVSEKKPTKWQTVKDMPKSIFRTCRQPVFIFLQLSNIGVLFSVMAFGAFGPKYIETQFHIPTSQANIWIGAKTIVANVIGTVGGGVVARHWKLGLKGCVKLITITRLIAFLLACFNYMFGCDNFDISGFDIDSAQVSPVVFKKDNTSVACDCTGATYLPVCGEGQTFFSPCHAGCETQVGQMYSNCSETASGIVTYGACDSGCNTLLAFVLVNGVSSLFNTMSISPMYVAAMRCVGIDDRSMAMGLQSFIMALLVYLPAPIIYGGQFDAVCLLWKNPCDQSGSCSIYNLADMRMRLVSIYVFCSGMGVLLAAGAWFFSRKAKDNEAVDVNQSMEVKPPIPQPRTSKTSLDL